MKKIILLILIWFISYAKSFAQDTIVLKDKHQSLNQQLKIDSLNTDSIYYKIAGIRQVNAMVEIESYKITYSEFYDQKLKLELDKIVNSHYNKNERNNVTISQKRRWNLSLNFELFYFLVPYKSYLQISDKLQKNTFFFGYQFIHYIYNAPNFELGYRHHFFKKNGINLAFSYTQSSGSFSYNEGGKFYNPQYFRIMNFIKTELGLYHRHGIAGGNVIEISANLAILIALNSGTQRWLEHSTDIGFNGIGNSFPLPNLKLSYYFSRNESVKK
jgi:hypothetical protein